MLAMETLMSEEKAEIFMILNEREREKKQEN